jgi:polysaccharide biosynthesis protein PslG
MRASRHRHLLAAAALLAAGSLCLPAAVQGASTRGSGALPPGFFGISPATHLSDAEYARMGAAQVGTLRLPFFWEDLQPVSRLHFDWSKTDEEMTGAALNGIPVLPYVMGVPRWLRSSSTSTDYPPLDQEGRDAWSALLGELVDRYGPGGKFWTLFSVLHPGVPADPIGEWQISNEPNDSSYSHPVATSPQRYAELLSLSHDVIKAHDPAALVISAGVFGTPGHGMTAHRFLSRMYEVPGIAGAFDALGLHPYAGGIPGVAYQIEDARKIMDRHGDASKPIWITELGWPTLSEVGGGFSTTEAGQKRLLVRSFNRIIAERSSWLVDRIVWYTWRDNSLFASCNLCRSSGLFRKDLTAKPAWGSFVGFTGGSPDAPAAPGGPQAPVP